MQRAVWILVVFIEGFASLGIEVIALRRLVPFVGSSITVTAPTIALFLLALAAGYWTGGQVKSGFERRVLRNFLIASLLAGIVLSSAFVQALFSAVADPQVAYLLFMALVVCPPAWLLAQTVPLLTNVMPHDRVGAASGTVLTASTAGSVVGASSLALVVMQRLGVSAAVLICSASLALAVAVAARREHRLKGTLLAGLLLLVVSAVNLMPGLNASETAYADYRVIENPPLDVASVDAASSRQFLVNNQRASRLGSGKPPERAAYIERIQHVLLGDLGLRGKSILVLGAGGFTLTGTDTFNYYTYVDIDPRIRAVAEREFLHAPIKGSFVADDARRFVAQTQRRFDSIVVDVYSSHASVPAHLVTLEFWRSLRRPLAPGGAVLVNLILDGALQSAYARNLLSTIELALGRCAIDVIAPLAAASNVVLTCRPASQRPETPAIYTDELNRVELDRGILGR
ncbi:MAG: fused MFS/spermidine synthase [Burkholderiales bacterium]